MMLNLSVFPPFTGHAFTVVTKNPLPDPRPQSSLLCVCSVAQSCPKFRGPIIYLFMYSAVVGMNLSLVLACELLVAAYGIKFPD